MQHHFKQKSMRYILGHNSVHPFPARMAPELVADAMAGHHTPMRILDPMSGSGTVLAIAQSMGHHAIGMDVDPLAVSNSRVWTNIIDPVDLKDAAHKVLSTAHKTFVSLRVRNAYPKNSDESTRKFARFWFDGYARRQLASLAAAIDDVDDEKIRNALWCAFSRLIITKKNGASLAMDLSHSRPHKVFKYAPSKPFSSFVSAVEHVGNNCIKPSDPRPMTCIREGDARNIPLADGSVDMVITSPPYLNAIDYMRCSKFSLIWMGHLIDEIRKIRSTSIGVDACKYIDNDYARIIISKINLRPKLQARQEAILLRYVEDMRRVINETARVLIEGGKALYVIGENTIQGTLIRNSMIMEKLAKDAGLLCISRRSRELPPNRRYLPPPIRQDIKTALDGRIRREVVLTLQKSKN